jgi:CheY-like chemotaxis protein
MSGDRDKILKAGCDDYLAKPIEKEQLFEMIEKYLD